MHRALADVHEACLVDAVVAGTVDTAELEPSSDVEIGSSNRGVRGSAHPRDPEGIDGLLGAIWQPCCDGDISWQISQLQR